jgi:hypothetical protein
MTQKSLWHSLKQMVVNRYRALEGQDRLLMGRVNNLFDLTKNNTPWALARFNDGEIKAMLAANIGEKTARDDQKIDQYLVDRLNWAIRQRQENLWLGLPCSVCWPRERAIAEESIEENYPRRALAVVQTNRNWNRWVTEFSKVAQARDIVWIAGEDQNLAGLQNGTGIKVRDQWRLPLANVWQKEYKALRKRFREFVKGDIVMLSCGPMATVLAVEWFQHRPDCTFIDIGSTFDPFTRDIWHDCHTGKLRRCIGCN